MNDVALIPVGMGNWTIRVTAKVRADPHSVVAWFQHPDRTEEALAELVKRGMTDCSIEDSFTDSVRIRDIRCNTPSGSALLTRSESQLGPDGHVGTWSGDRFLLVGHVSIQERTSNGRLKTKEWDETYAYVPSSAGTTEIVRTHHQRLIHPRWDEWLLPPLTERARNKRLLRDLAARCESDLGVLRDD
jgi:hypothetical protein